MVSFIYEQAYLLFIAVLDDVGDVLENIDIIERQKVPVLFYL